MWIADRANKRVLLLCTQTAMMMCAFTMAGLAYFKVITITQLAILSCLKRHCSGPERGLSTRPSCRIWWIARHAQRHCVNTVAVQSLPHSWSNTGGYAVAFIGVAGNFFPDGLSFLAVIFAVARIDMPRATAPRHREGTLKSLHEGFKYVRSIPEMYGIVWMVMSISLFLLPFITLHSILRAEYSDGRRARPGFMMACSGTGALISALIVAHFASSPAVFIAAAASSSSRS